MTPTLEELDTKAPTLAAALRALNEKRWGEAIVTRGLNELEWLLRDASDTAWQISAFREARAAECEALAEDFGEHWLDRRDMTSVVEALRDRADVIRRGEVR